LLCRHTASTRITEHIRVIRSNKLVHRIPTEPTQHQNVIQVKMRYKSTRSQWGFPVKWPFTHRHEIFFFHNSSLPCLQSNTCAFDRFDPTSIRTLPIHSFCLRDIPHSNGTKTYDEQYCHFTHNSLHFVLCSNQTYELQERSPKVEIETSERICHTTHSSRDVYRLVRFHR